MQARTPALPSMLRTRPYGRAPAPSIGRCIYCGRAEGLLTREHVIPKSLGGHFQAPQDPNWFYSFLSQSAAAVIGVLGAVLVSRLLQALLEARATAARVIDSFVATRNALVARTNEIEGYAAFLADKLPHSKHCSIAASQRLTPRTGRNSALRHPAEVSERNCHASCSFKCARTSRRAG